MLRVKTMSRIQHLLMFLLFRPPVCLYRDCCCRVIFARSSSPSGTIMSPLHMLWLEACLDSLSAMDYFLTTVSHRQGECELQYAPKWHMLQRQCENTHLGNDFETDDEMLMGGWTCLTECKRKQMFSSVKDRCRLRHRLWDRKNTDVINISSKGI